MEVKPTLVIQGLAVLDLRRGPWGRTFELQAPISGPPTRHDDIRCRSGRGCPSSTTPRQVAPQPVLRFASSGQDKAAGHARIWRACEVVLPAGRYGPIPAARHALGWCTYITKLSNGVTPWLPPGEFHAPSSRPETGCRRRSSRPARRGVRTTTGRALFAGGPGSGRHDRGRYR